MTMDMKLNAQRIRALRERRAWSQEHLAAVAGLSARTLQRLEAGAGASHDTCLALAAALEVPVAELAAETPEGPGRATGHAGPPASPLPLWMMLAMLGVALVVAFGYTIGKDMALRDNRADAACARGASACEDASAGISIR